MLLSLNLSCNNRVPTEISQNSEPEIPQNSNFGFYCGTYKDFPATNFGLTSENYDGIPIIVYESEYFSSLGYTSRSRCEEISARFQRAYTTGRLSNIIAGELNGVPTICAVWGEQICSAENLLFTLHPSLTEAEKQEILETLFSIVDPPNPASFDYPNPASFDPPNTLYKVLYDTQFGFNLYGDPTTPPPFPKPITSPPQEPIDPPPKK